MLSASSREIQRNYRSLFEQVKRKKEPLFILKGSEPEMVVLSLSMYEDLLKQGGAAESSDHPWSRLPWRT
ncbi:MAG: type II toxin-antitoxin system Phd/YefM family antitoxin [Candidatus Gracilibacteria bacterium]|nr:type II toxin-antitoxin system Phd/YefM family antitoxin [Candidatus Gracilibacteria bacterium]